MCCYVRRAGEGETAWAEEEEKGWTNCVVEDRRLFGMAGGRSVTSQTLGLGTVQHSMLKGLLWVCGRMGKGKRRGKRRPKIGKEREADKVNVVWWVTVASLRRFRAALIEPTEELPKRRRLHQ